jgi:hypothetical protein
MGRVCGRTQGRRSPPEILPIKCIDKGMKDLNVVLSIYQPVIPVASLEKRRSPQSRVCGTAPSRSRRPHPKISKSIRNNGIHE